MGGKARAAAGRRHLAMPEDIKDAFDSLIEAFGAREQAVAAIAGRMSADELSDADPVAGMAHYLVGLIHGWAQLRGVELADADRMFWWDYDLRRDRRIPRDA